MIPMPMATVNKIANGYLVRFHRPVERERAVPSPVPPGFFEAQASIAMAMRGSDDDELVGAEAWENDRRDTREKRVRAEIAKAERRLAGQKVKVWVIEPQDFVAQTLADVGALLQQADAAFEKMLELMRAGVTVHGLLPGSGIVPA